MSMPNFVYSFCFILHKIHKKKIQYSSFDMYQMKKERDSFILYAFSLFFSSSHFIISHVTRNHSKTWPISNECYVEMIYVRKMFVVVLTSNEGEKLIWILVLPKLFQCFFLLCDVVLLIFFRINYIFKTHAHDVSFSAAFVMRFPFPFQ